MLPARCFVKPGRQHAVTLAGRLLFLAQTRSRCHRPSPPSKSRSALGRSTKCQALWTTHVTSLDSSRTERCRSSN
uniref:Uncharacterized protein n=1 Tax=Zea mays TaxID=4577 RepID=A0A804NPV7_MAIZE